MEIRPLLAATRLSAMLISVLQEYDILTFYRTGVHFSRSCKDNAMLVAYGPDGHPVVAEETPLGQLQQWSHEHMLHCPNCRGSVHVRGGAEKRTQLHFAHQKGECAWSTESESVRHATGKIVIAQWLRAQFPAALVTLEERLPEPNRIADVFVTHADGQRWAVEFQCAPLDIAEWKMRHDAYRKAGITDTWLIGSNRREKQEAFIEAILQLTHEILFLDPLITPPQAWFRWAITRHQAQQWQEKHPQIQSQLPNPQLTGWVGRLGYGMTLTGSFHDIHLDKQAHLLHPIRTTIETQARLLKTMRHAEKPDEALLSAYLQQHIEEEALRVVLLPLLRAYLHDPDLLYRYNYGRGQADQPVSKTDALRVHKAQEWLHGLTQQGFAPTRLHLLLKELPLVGSYAAFASYAEMLLAVVRM